MKLLVDIGNSQVKWCYLDSNGLSDAENFKRNKTGDLMVFNLRYMGALSIMNSNYIEKVTE